MLSSRRAVFAALLDVNDMFVDRNGCVLRFLFKGDSGRLGRARSIGGGSDGERGNLSTNIEIIRQ